MCLDVRSVGRERMRVADPRPFMLIPHLPVYTVDVLVSSLSGAVERSSMQSCGKLKRLWTQCVAQPSTPALGAGKAAEGRAHDWQCKNVASAEMLRDQQRKILVALTQQEQKP